jgi:hypothetical protein
VTVYSTIARSIVRGAFLLRSITFHQGTLLRIKEAFKADFIICEFALCCLSVSLLVTICN